MSDAADPARLDRRRFGAIMLSAAAAAPAGRAAAQPPLPVIVAEGGAAEERIEDTRSALDLAINQGCDFLQVNLTPSREGALVARRSSELSQSTDVSIRPEFADRRSSKVLDGGSVTGWFSEDFTLAELQTLNCREAQPDIRPQNVALNGKEPVLALSDVLSIARAGCVRAARTIGVCVALVRPTYYQGVGLDVVQRLADELGSEGYISAAAAIWTQALEPEALAAFAKLSPVRRMLLVGSGQPPDASALAAAGSVAHAISAEQDLLISSDATLSPTPLAGQAHAAGLRVFSRTARGENAFLPPSLRRGDAPAARGDARKLIAALFAAGVDGLATDIPAEAARARRSLARS